MVQGGNPKRLSSDLASGRTRHPVEVVPRYSRPLSVLKLLYMRLSQIERLDWLQMRPYPDSSSNEQKERLSFDTVEHVRGMCMFRHKVL